MVRVVKPRYMILGLLIGLGLALRLWGITWGLGHGGVALHPGEWAWQIIDSLSWTNPSYQGIWTQSFFSLAALLAGAVNTTAAWLADWFGYGGANEAAVLSARLAGRITVALLGAAQVAVAYPLARRIFDSVATGLLAAALVAVNPLLVAYGHFLSLDVPLGLMVLVCLLAIAHLLESPSIRLWAIAGLVLGLTVTTKASGVLMAPLFLLAYIFCILQTRPSRGRRLLLWPLSFLGGLILGLALGYPGFLISAPDASQVVYGSTAWPPGGADSFGGFLTQRAEGCVEVITQAVGWEMVALWAVSLGLAIAWGKTQRLVVGLWPLLYVPASLMLLSGGVEGLQAVWVPAALVMAAWPPILLCRRMPGYWTPVVAACAVGVLICAWPLWRSLGVAHLFWQPESRIVAKEWIEDNLPHGARVLLGSGYLFEVDRPARPLEQVTDWSQLRNLDGFAVVTPFASDRTSVAASEAASLELSGSHLRQTMQLLTEINLKDSTSPPGQDARPLFPLWLSPVVRVYSTEHPRKLKMPLAIRRPPVGLGRGYQLVMTQSATHARPAGVARLSKKGSATRVLRHIGPLGPVRLYLSNQGQDLARLVIRQGFWQTKALSLYPGQEMSLALSPGDWPLFIGGYYPVGISLLQGEEVIAALQTDPLLLGRRALEQGRHKTAVRQLRQAVTRHRNGFDARALLAGALSRSGDLAGAEAVVASLGKPDSDPLLSYRALAVGVLKGADWDRRLGLLTGYHPRLLRQALMRTYVIGGSLAFTGRNETTLRGLGFHGAFRGATKNGRPRIKLWLDHIYPRGPWRAEFGLSLDSKIAPEQKVARLELWAHHGRGSRKLGQRIIRGADLDQGKGPIIVEGANPHAWARAEVRMILPGEARPRLETVRMGISAQGHMRSMLRWYDEARGMVALQAGRAAEAISAFESLLDLDPGFSRVYIPLARALLESGKKKGAQAMVARAERVFQSNPAELGEILKLYKTMGNTADLQRVEKRLAHLRPSLGSGAVFDSGMTLLGYDLPQAKVERGKEMAVSYYWQVDSPPLVNYAIFVHLVGKGKRYSFDHFLDHNRKPMEDLSKGQVVREDYQIRIPEGAAPGRYRLVVGLWDSRFTRKRVGVADSKGVRADEITLAEIEVR